VLGADLIAPACLHILHNQLGLEVVWQVKQLAGGIKQLLQLLICDAVACDCQEAC
jgi:hypothetical protein